MKGLPRKGSRLLRITTKTEDQTMDQNKGLEAYICEEQIGNIIMMDPQEIFPHLLETSLQGPTSNMRTVTRTTEDHMINASISHSTEMKEIALEMDLLTIRMGSGETMEIFLVLHRLKEETSHKIIPIANQEVINLSTLLSADLKTDLRLVLHITNTNSHKAIIRHHLMSFASPPLTIPLMNYQIFAR